MSSICNVKSLNHFRFHELMAMIPDSALDACLKAVDEHGLADLQAFVPEFGECERHGRFPLNAEQDGQVVWMLDHCPACAREARLERLFESAAIPEILRHATFDNYRCLSDVQRSVFQQVRDYAGAWTGDIRSGSSSRILVGNPGTGKNHLVVSLARVLMRRGVTVRVIKSRDLIEKLWSLTFEQRGDFLKRLAGIGLLVIDELDKGYSEGAGVDELFRVIDGRNESARPTFVVGNGSVDSLKRILGPASFDRLKHHGGKAWVFDWGSGR